MIFDLIFAILIGSFIGMSGGNGGSEYAAPAAPPAAPAAALQTAPDHITQLIVGELSCERAPDPTAVLRAMMDEGLIRAEERIDYESYSCFPLSGGLDIASFNANAVCGGVLDAATNGANPDLYPPNENIADEDRYQFIALASNEPLGVLTDWYSNIYGPRVDDATGVTDGLYGPEFSLNEIYCDDFLADDVAYYSSAPQVETDEMPGDLPLPPASPAQ